MAEPVFHNYKALRGLKTSGACLFNPSPGLVEDSPLPKYEVRGGGRKEVDLCSEDGKGKTMEILLNDNGRVVSVTDDAPPSPLFDELKFPLPAGVMPFEAWPPTRLVDPATGGGGPTERRPFWYLSQFGHNSYYCTICRQVKQLWQKSGRPGPHEQFYRANFGVIVLENHALGMVCHACWETGRWPIYDPRKQYPWIWDEDEVDGYEMTRNQKVQGRVSFKARRWYNHNHIEDDHQER